jgi:hypothetical protein
LNYFNKSIIYYFVVFFILSFGIYARFSYYNDGLWSDEWISFLFSNPEISFYKNYVNHLTFEGAPPIILISNLFWSKILGHYYQTIELASIAYSFASILLLVFFFKIDKKKKIFFLFLVSVNPFLIYYAGEARFYSASVFFGLLSIISFLHLSKKYNLFCILLFILTTLISLSVNLYFLSVFVSYFFLCFIKNKKNLFPIFFFTFLLFIIFNYYYLINITSLYHNSGAAGSINYKFFIGYFFNIFFADVVLGGFFLLFLIFCIYLFRNEIKKDNELFLFILIIFFSYLIPLLYSIFFSQITHPRHLINIVIPIIYLISNFIFKLNIRSYLRFCLSFVIIFYSIFIHFKKDKPYILLKPNPDYIIKYISESDINFLYIPNYINNFNLNFSKNLLTTSDQIYSLYNYFFLYSKDFDKKIYVINDNNYLKHDSFWTICLNNSSFAAMVTISESRCVNNKLSDNYILSKVIKNSEFILSQYRKKN